MDEKGKRYRIVYDRKACIGAAACAAVAPQFWKMREDGKADLEGFKLDEKGNQVLIIHENELTDGARSALVLNKEAAEVCPVQAIQVFDDESGERII